MRKVIPLLAVAVIIAVLAFWHGATESPVSKAALYLLPVLIALGLVARSSKRVRSTRP
jgi:peptidoglycan/LPS O-acetylase OafA/YrhL